MSFMFLYYRLGHMITPKYRILGYPNLIHTIPHSAILENRNWKDLYCYMLAVVTIDQVL